MKLLSFRETPHALLHPMRVKAMLPVFWRCLLTPAVAEIAWQQIYLPKRRTSAPANR